MRTWKPPSCYLLLAHRAFPGGAGRRLSKGLSPDVNRVLWARSLRAFGDGYVAILLPLHLSGLGYDPLAVGVISTATLLGSALLTLGIGLVAHRIRRQTALLGAALLMTATGIGFAGTEGFWPLLVVAFVGTLNPSGGDVSVFLPLEHTVVAHVVADEERTAVFARYSFVGAFFGALGALSVGTVDWLAPFIASPKVTVLLFGLYGVLGILTFLLYRGLSPKAEVGEDSPAAPLGPSRGTVYRLAALFSVDAFGGGLVVNALLALWLSERFGISISTVGAIFFVTNAAPPRPRSRTGAAPRSHWTSSAFQSIAMRVSRSSCRTGALPPRWPLADRGVAAVTAPIRAVTQPRRDTWQGANRAGRRQREAEPREAGPQAANSSRRTGE